MVWSGYAFGNISQGGKGHAVDRGRAQASQGNPVHNGAIAFVTGEAIAGVTLVEQAHQAVTRDFRNNRGSRHR